MGKFFVFFTAVISAAFVLGCGASVHALVLSPTVLEYDVAKGSTLSRTIHLKNDTSSPVTAKPTVYAVTSQDEHGFPEFAPLTDDVPLKKWISFGTIDAVALDAGKETDVQILVTVPAEAAPGGYYATVTWDVKREDGTIGLVPSPGVNIALSVPGPVTQKASIAQFSLEKQKGLGLSLPLVFLTKVRNEGGVHFTPEGTIEIKNIFGSVVARVPVLSQKDVSLLGTRHNGNVLPGATRILYGTWGNAFAFGPYTATLVLDTHGAGMLSAQTSFFITSPVLPYLWYAIISLGIVLLLRFILTLIRTFHIR